MALSCIDYCVSNWCIWHSGSSQICQLYEFYGRTRLREHTLNALIHVDGWANEHSGNGEFSGQVVCGVRRNGRTVRKPVGGVFPELLKAQDRFPSELSCAEASLADPQSMAANITAATIVVDMVYNILVNGECSVRQADFSTRTIRMQTALEKKRAA